MALAAVDEAAEEAKAGRLGWNKQHPHTTKQCEPNFQSWGRLKLFNRHGFLLSYWLVSIEWRPSQDTEGNKRQVKITMSIAGVLRSLKVLDPDQWRTRPWQVQFDTCKEPGVEGSTRSVRWARCTTAWEKQGLPRLLGCWLFGCFAWMRVVQASAAGKSPQFAATRINHFQTFEES